MNSMYPFELDIIYGNIVADKKRREKEQLNGINLDDAGTDF